LDDRENTDGEEYSVLSVQGFMTDWRLTSDGELVCSNNAATSATWKRESRRLKTTCSGAAAEGERVEWGLLADRDIIVSVFL
jgi:hypothetical protein